MRKLLFHLLIILFCSPCISFSQISILSTDMPAVGDTLITATDTNTTGMTIGNAGVNQTLSTNFTPDDVANYNLVIGRTVQITVNKATPVITWTNPASIAYGTALSATQLNATASVAGAFTYTPVSGTVLDVGASQVLSTNFTPKQMSTWKYSTTSFCISTKYI